jgi:hypothetical protein
MNSKTKTVDAVGQVKALVTLYPSGSENIPFYKL